MDAVRAELSKLQQQRTALEAEINERSARLNGPGQPGMHDSLIDKEVSCDSCRISFRYPVGPCKVLHACTSQTLALGPDGHTVVGALAWNYARAAAATTRPSSVWF